MLSGPVAPSHETATCPSATLRVSILPWLGMLSCEASAWSALPAPVSAGPTLPPAPRCSPVSLVTSAGFPCATFSSVDIRAHETSRGELISMATPRLVRIIMLFVTVCAPVSVFATTAEWLDAPVPGGVSARLACPLATPGKMETAPRSKRTSNRFLRYERFMSPPSPRLTEYLTRAAPHWYTESSAPARLPACSGVTCTHLLPAAVDQPCMLAWAFPASHQCGSSCLTPGANFMPRPMRHRISLRLANF